MSQEISSSASSEPEITHNPHASVPADVLPARRRFSWANFGGDGFLVSLVVHIILALVAIFWVVRTLVQVPSEEPTTFATGAGGGTGGERAKNFEHRITPKNARNMVKTPNKITVKGATASIALPDMPNIGMSAFETGALMGGSSKGLGGGAGGGEGTGIGVGRGGGRNMVSLFGMRGFGADNGLIGTFYDLKQTADGKPTDMAPNDKEGRQKYADKVRTYARSEFKEGILSSYFKSDERLVATQFFMVRMGAEGAPQAFNVPQVKPSRWLVHYTGTLKAPKSGRFRLVGVGDDILSVYWRDKLVLDAGYDFMSEREVRGTGKAEPKNGTGNRITKEEEATWGKPGFGLRYGTWVDVTRGQDYKADVLIGETPGGVFEAYLMLEEAESPSSRKGTGKLILFKIGSTPLPDEIAKGYSKINCDMSGGEWIWQPAARRVRR